MRIQHNIMAQNASRLYNNNTSALSKNLEKLSSGYRINRSADDAAGLAVSEMMRFQIAGLEQSMNNAQDGISLIQTAEGALTEVHDMLDRIVELSTQVANGTYSDSDRAKVNKELTELKAEIDRIGETTNFNTIALFQGGSAPNVTKVEYNFELDLNTRTMRMTETGVNGSSGALDVSGVKDGYKVLAEKIANEYFPNAINQILTAFPSLGTAVGSDTINMKLEVGFIDGASGTLAYAQCAFNPNLPDSKPVQMLIKVDTSDFSDASLNGANLEKLESTLAHELMHSVMQYTMTDEMTGRTGAGEEFPEWFVEGTAQLAGGGFPTNWNYTLQQLANGLSGATDTGKDTDIENYLAQHTIDGRPYGHGYLISAYLGYLANGGTGAADGTSIAAGMDKIFAGILGGKTLYEAVAANTSINATSMTDLTNKLNALFSGKDAGLVSFVRQLSYNSKGGAGSVIASSLGTGGGNIVGNATGLNSPFGVTDIVHTSGGSTITAADQLQLQVGIESDSSTLTLDLFEMNSSALGLDNVDITTDDGAREAIGIAKNAIGTVSSMRSYYGAMQNRLEHSIKNIGVTVENIANAESVIRDTDVAEEMMAYTKNNILIQSAQAMLAQANTVPQGVLSMLR